MFKQLLGEFTPQDRVRLLHQVGVLPPYVPPIGQVRLRNFAQTTPSSTNFGYDREGIRPVLYQAFFRVVSGYDTGLKSVN
jgi:hypothetical protein